MGLSPLAARARARRHLRFLGLTGLQAESRIVDLGCGPLGLEVLAPELDVTPVAQPDLSRELPFSDGEFDLAYSASLIERLDPAERPALAAEVGRIARGWWVQTPRLAFPVQAHGLHREEMLRLFGEPILADRVLGVARSWISVRAIDD